MVTLLYVYIPVSDEIEVPSIQEVTVKDFEYTTVGSELFFSWETVGYESYERVVHYIRLLVYFKLKLHTTSSSLIVCQKLILANFFFFS